MSARLIRADLPIDTRDSELNQFPAKDELATSCRPSSITPPADLQSAIYEGWVRHRRYAPHAHEFHYRTFQLWIDLAELDHLFDRRWLWSIGRRNIAEFRRGDYLGANDIPLDEAVRQRVAEKIGRRPSGPIRLLTHLRYFGHCFNPVSFYYCYETDGTTLDCIVAEITNTPWNERHAYVLPIDQAESTRNVFAWDFRKAFHVSPFMPMDRNYAWRFSAPDRGLRVHMEVRKDGRREFDATVVMQRKQLDAHNLARVLLRYPAMTVQVVAAIHWQALRLWLLGNPVYSHPQSAEVEQSESSS